MDVGLLLDCGLRNIRKITDNIVTKTFSTLTIVRDSVEFMQVSYCFVAIGSGFVRYFLMLVGFAHTVRI